MHRHSGGLPTAVARGDPALVKGLAPAFRWKRMFDDGRYGSIRELADAENVNRAYVARLLDLTLLAPDIVDAALDGQHAERLTLASALQTNCPEWEAQPTRFGLKVSQRKH